MTEKITKPFVVQYANGFDRVEGISTMSSLNSIDIEIREVTSGNVRKAFPVQKNWNIIYPEGKAAEIADIFKSLGAVISYGFQNTIGKCTIVQVFADNKAMQAIVYE